MNPDSVSSVTKPRSLFKDWVLDQTAQLANVAQFVSFAPDLTQRFSWIRGSEPNHPFPSPESAVSALLENSPDESVNIRSFEPDVPESREFVYGLRSVDDVVRKLRELGSQGLFTIVNETVDVHDGGVSGVVLGDIVEFAPGDTPRAVEKPGVASLPRDLGLRLLTTVYGFDPGLDYSRDHRVEFSIHPTRRGVRHQHTIVWQVEDVGKLSTVPTASWPNRFSRFIGDKTFGLLIADALGAPVPATLVLPRRLPPFRFGTSTATGETWLRTCPTEQQPGRFTTAPKWVDPFTLLAAEDPDGSAIAAVLAQEGVEPRYSGALVVSKSGRVVIEGVHGKGDAFMVGRDAPEQLPDNVGRSVLSLYRDLSTTLGPIRMEWVHDGHQAWVVQLHRGATSVEGRIIVPGDVSRYRRFDVSRGIEAFRSLAEEASSNGEGVILVGHIGITSHFGDILRRLAVPSMIEEPS